MWLSWENQTFLNTCNHLALSEKIKIHLEKQRLISLVQLQAAVFFFPLLSSLASLSGYICFSHKHTRILTRVLKAVRHLFRCAGWRPRRLETRDTPSERPCDALQPTSPQSDLSLNRQERKHGSPHCLLDGKVALFNLRKIKPAGRDRGGLQIKHRPLKDQEERL